jgi:MarR family transcriptional regulator for hemolysin
MSGAPPSDELSDELDNFQIYRAGGSTRDIRLTIHLVLAARRWRSLLDERLRQIGQSAQVDIARRLRIEGPTMTRMLDTLEADGLVERLPDPGDRRTKQLRVTPAGETALAEIFAIVDELRSRLLTGISAEKIDELNLLFEMLMGRLDNGLPPPG